MGYAHLPIYMQQWHMSNTSTVPARRPRRVSADDRSRVALGKTGVGAYEDFFVTVLDTGQIVLTPAATIPKNEMALWNDAEFMSALTNGINQAVSGQTKSLDHLIYNSKDTEAKKKSIKSGQGKRAKAKV